MSLVVRIPSTCSFRDPGCDVLTPENTAPISGDTWPGDGFTHHVLQIGQSNAVGAAAVNPDGTIVTGVSFPGVSMLTPLAAATSGTSGIRAPMTRLVSASEYTSLVSLAETHTIDDNKDVDDVTGHFTGAVASFDYGETGLGSMLNDLRRRFHLFRGVGTTNGDSSQSYNRLKKGTDPYTNGMTQITSVRDLAGANPSRVFAIAVQHGEADAFNGSYSANLQTWLADWTTDIRAAIPAQSTDPIMIQVQVSSQPSPKTSALQQLAATLANPRIYIATPGYACSAAGPHQSAHGQMLIGTYFSKVYQRVVLLGQSWSPLRPVSASRSGAVITVTFNVFAPPLVFDIPPTQSMLSAKGFEYSDDSSSATATGATISGNTVQVTLSGIPTGASPRIKYAVNNVFGNLRDSDSFLSYYQDTTYNWCVHFDMAVT